MNTCRTRTPFIGQFPQTHFDVKLGYEYWDGIRSAMRTSTCSCPVG
jgi:hypothetical protein